MFRNMDNQIMVFRAPRVKIQGRDILTHGLILTKIALTMGRLLKEGYPLLLLHPWLRQYSIRPFSNIRDTLTTKLNLVIHDMRMDKILSLRELHPPRVSPRIIVNPSADTNERLLAPELMTSDVEGVGIGLRTRPTEKKLKNSKSTPDLRSSQVVNYATRFSKSFRQAPPPVLVPHQPRPLPKGKDRWLSAETWCDALLFPRPRLKIKHDEISASELLVEDTVAAEGSLVLPIRRGSNRIVSPPGSPLGGEWDVEILNGVETQILENQQLLQDRSCVGIGSSHEQKQREPGVASRVLAHSRSLIDLGQRHRMGMEVQRARVPNELPVEINAVDEKVAVQHRKPLIAEAGPSKFVRGEFVFPTPPPSLDQ